MSPDPIGSDPIPVVVYASKSTEDVHGSTPTQLQDGHALAQREGWTRRRGVHR